MYYHHDSRNKLKYYLQTLQKRAYSDDKELKRRDRDYKKKEKNEKEGGDKRKEKKRKENLKEKERKKEEENK